MRVASSKGSLQVPRLSEQNVAGIHPDKLDRVLPGRISSKDTVAEPDWFSMAQDATYLICTQRFTPTDPIANGVVVAGGCAGSRNNALILLRDLPVAPLAVTGAGHRMIGLDGMIAPKSPRNLPWIMRHGSIPNRRIPRPQQQSDSRNPRHRRGYGRERPLFQLEFVSY